MKKKVIIILIIIGVILAIIIPLAVRGGAREGITIPSSLVNNVKTEEDIQAEKQRVMEKYTTYEMKPEVEIASEEIEDMSKETDADKLEKVLKKFYKQEVENAIDEIEKEIEIRDANGETVVVTDAEYKIFDIALRILENGEKLDEEEKKILDEYVDFMERDAKKKNRTDILTRVENLSKE